MGMVECVVLAMVPTFLVCAVDRLVGPAPTRVHAAPISREAQLMEALHAIFLTLTVKQERGVSRDPVALLLLATLHLLSLL